MDEDMDGSFRGRLTCTDWQKPQDRPSPNRDATSAEEQSARSDGSDAAVDGAKRIEGWLCREVKLGLDKRLALYMAVGSE